jgi:hypothetical protein
VSRARASRLSRRASVIGMAELKTQRNPGDVEAFLAKVPDPARRADAQAVCHLIAEVTGEQPAMWGTSIVGFGTYHYRYARRFTTGKSCLHLKRLADADQAALRQLVAAALIHLDGRTVTT